MHAILSAPVCHLAVTNQTQYKIELWAIDTWHVTLPYRRKDYFLAAVVLRQIDQGLVHWICYRRRRHINLCDGIIYHHEYPESLFTFNIGPYLGIFIQSKFRKRGYIPITPNCITQKKCLQRQDY